MFAWEWPAVFGEWLACSHISPCSSLRQAEPRAGLVHPVYYITSTNCTICGLLRSACLFWVFFSSSFLYKPSSDRPVLFFLSRWLRWLLLTQTASPASLFSEKSWWRILKKKKKKKNKLLSRRRDGGTRTRTLGARCALTRGLLHRSTTLFYFVLQFFTCCRVPACEAGGEKEVDPRSGSVAGLVASLYTAAAAAAAVCECPGSHRDSALGSVQPQKWSGWSRCRRGIPQLLPEAFLFFLFVCVCVCVCLCVCVCVCVCACVVRSPQSSHSAPRLKESSGQLSASLLRALLDL